MSAERARIAQQISIRIRTIAREALHVGEREIDRQMLQRTEAESCRQAQLIHAGSFRIQILALDRRFVKISSETDVQTVGRGILRTDTVDAGILYLPNSESGWKFTSKDL